MKRCGVCAGCISDGYCIPLLETSEAGILPLSPVRRIQLVVWHRGETKPNHYPVPREGGWKIDTLHRQIVIGTGLPRTMLPLDNIMSYSVEEY